MTHKSFVPPEPLSEHYIPLQVGAAENGAIPGYLTDDTGDNISDLNHLYGELTGFYWIWKNDRDSDIIGVCHYRRYFTDDEGMLLSAADYEAAISDGGVLLSQSIPCEETYRENFVRAHHERDAAALDYGIETVSPEYMAEYREVMNGHKRYFGNLLVMHRDDFMSYCRWLFDVLLAASEKVDVSGYDAYHARIYGFLSEELTYVWALHNKKTIHEGHVIMTAEKAESVELKKALSVLIKEGRISEAKQMFSEVEAVRPDVTLKSADLSGELRKMWDIIVMTELEQKVESVAQELVTEIEATDISKLLEGDTAARWQGMFMELGEELEAAGYSDSDVIHELEVCCELCYQVTQSGADAGIIRHSLLIECKELLYHYYYSMRAGMHRLSITSILKNEPDIIEWIEYHLLVGVDHFYLYDNESTDGLREKLSPYIDAGIVTYTYYPGAAMQDKSVNDAISKYKYDTKYLAVIDGDEYIVPVAEGQMLPELLDDIIERYHKHRYNPGGFAGGVGINWRDYGTSGHRTPAPGLCIENYLMRGEDDYFQNVHIKTIYNPRVVDFVDNPHNGHYRPGYYTISEKGSMIPFLYFYDGHCERLRINHYFSKSEEQLLSKNKRGWPVGDLKRDDDTELYEASVNCNKIHDPIMLRYVDAVKNKIEERNRS